MRTAGRCARSTSSRCALMTRDDIAKLVALTLERPARWIPDELSVGDYDGRQRTLQVFNAEPAEQLSLVQKLEPMRNVLHAAARGPIVILFHSRKQSKKYEEFLASSQAKTAS